MEAFLFENDVDNMRARELRNLLIQKLGVDPALIARIIDRDELKRMVNSIVYEKYRAQVRQGYIQLSYKAGAVVAVLLVLFLCRNIIWGFIVSVSEMIGETSYKSSKKFKLLMYNVKRRKFTGALALTVSLLLELAVMWMKVAVMLSWVLSRDHFLRRFMLPTLSFPVSANTLVGAATGRSAASTQAGSEPTIGAALGSYSMDLGPMITIAALNFLIAKLDNLAAGIVLEHKRTKEERRNRRFYAAHPGTTAADGDQQDAVGEGAGGDSAGLGSSSGVGAVLRKRASARKTDAESIEDSLNTFFGRSRGSNGITPTEDSPIGSRSGTSSNPSRTRTTEQAAHAEPAQVGVSPGDSRHSDFEDYEVVGVDDDDNVPDLLRQAGDTASTEGGAGADRDVDVDKDEAGGEGETGARAAGGGGARWTID